MAKKKKNRGDLNTVSSMGLMAHKLGIRSKIELTDTEITEQTFEYEIVFEDAPIENWLTSPDDTLVVRQNMNAVIFNVAIEAAARVGVSIEKGLGEVEDDVYFNNMLSNQIIESWQSVSDFLKWYKKEEFNTDSIHKYLFELFHEEANTIKTQQYINHIADLVCLNGCEMSLSKFRKLTSRLVPFGILKWDPSLLHGMVGFSAK